MVAVIAVVAVTITLNVGNVYAGLGTETLILTPNPVTQGMNVVASGAGWLTSSTDPTNFLEVSSGTPTLFGCTSSGSTLINFVPTTDSSGNLNPVTIPTTSLSPGTYCVSVEISTDVLQPLTESFTTTLTVTGSSAPVIPEYPFGLPLLAIFLVVLYGLVRRRIRN